jgi:hypothetical protein
LLKSWFNFFYLFIFAFPCLALSFTDPGHKAKREYLELHQQFSRKLCTAGVEQKYDQLLRNYRGNGLFLPEFKGDVDTEAISLSLQLMIDKKHWLEQQIQLIEKSPNNWPYFKKISVDLIHSKDLLIEYKKLYHLAITEEQKQKVLAQSNDEMMRFKNYFNNFVSQIPFLLSFNYPVDHLKNRKEFDDLKDSKKDSDIHKSNVVYLKRRTLEDGAMDPNRTNSDRFLRSTLDTLGINIPNETFFISENIRYDIEWIINRVDGELRKGRKQTLARLKEWHNRTTETILFYRQLIRPEQTKEIDKIKHLSKNKILMQQKIDANNKLQDFVIEKLRDTYLFWAQQTPLMRSLFSLETILYNEVGRVDGKHALDRFDVARVVKRRTQDKFYSSLPKDELLAQSLSTHLNETQIASNHWLNVMFKKGEFSFTYFYIAGVAKIFCPDMTRIGKTLRQRNLDISYYVLQESEMPIDAIRYFSRASMNGRIDMSTVWSDYQAIPERAGVALPSQSRLRSYYMGDKYRYLYSFEDDVGITYQVVEIRDQVYVMGWKDTKPHFYTYRNPHYFKYFKKIN